jgi:hypothetical protein
MCARESAGGATAQVVTEHRLFQPLYPLALQRNEIVTESRISQIIERAR